ncbi:hypothetical protein ACW9KT_12470 [Hymenobacter sp. HD11105]
MDKKMLFKARLYFTGLITLAIWSLLIWGHYHGGVPSHHILARADMPEISNWWGGISIPLLTWFLLYRIETRINNNSHPSAFSLNIIYAFTAALLFGIVLSIFFTLGNPNIPGYMIIGAFVLALFLPIYRAECLLGFVIGMCYKFGGVLPIIAGSIILLIGAVLYLVVRPVFLYIVSGLIHATSSNKHKAN